METLQALTEQRKSIVDSLAAMDARIASHPEHIATFFEAFASHPGCAEHIAKIASIVDADGWTESRKNATQWSGYRFRLRDDEQAYWMRSGSNWCSDFTDCGKDGDEQCTDIPLGELMEMSDKSDPDKLAHFIASKPTVMAIGCMLRVKDGW